MKRLRRMMHERRTKKGTMFVYLKSGNVIEFDLAEGGGYEETVLGDETAKYTFNKVQGIHGFIIQPTQIEAIVVK